MQLRCGVMVAGRDWKLVIALGTLLVGVALAGASAHASVIGYTSSGGSHDPNQSFTMGVRFTANQSIVIDSLGVLDVDSNGLDAAHEVGLWDDSGNMLASKEVLAGTQSTLQDGFRFESLDTQVQLAAGETYYVAAYYATNERGDKLFSPTPAPSSAITLDPVTMWASGNSLAFPAMENIVDFRSTAGFTFVPEPTTALLLMAGLAGLALRGGRSRA